MASITDIKWTKIILIILSLQLLNYSFVLPYVVSYASSDGVSTTKNDAIVAHALEDLFHLGNQGNNGQDETPLDSDDLSVEKEVELHVFHQVKKEYLILGNLNLQYVLYNKIAASIHQPELNTPPPKTA